VISFGAWLIIVLKYAGLKLLIKDLFANKADRKERPAGFIRPSPCIYCGRFIEVMSIMIRPVTLSVRLFGNIFGGENRCMAPVLFLFLLHGAARGLIQALVFTLLTSVYIGLICNHGDEHDHAEEGHAAGATLTLFRRERASRAHGGYYNHQPIHHND